MITLLQGQLKSMLINSLADKLAGGDIMSSYDMSHEDLANNLCLRIQDGEDITDPMEMLTLCNQIRQGRRTAGVPAARAKAVKTKVKQDLVPKGHVEDLTDLLDQTLI